MWKQRCKVEKMINYFGSRWMTIAHLCADLVMRFSLWVQVPRVTSFYRVPLMVRKRQMDPMVFAPTSLSSQLL